MSTTRDHSSTLRSTAEAMVAPGRGILAADESTGTIAKRLASIGVESTEATRRDYRELLFRTPDYERHVSGVILFDETLRQRAADGTALVEVLRERGVIPGIKVDAGTAALPFAPEETITEGLDGLRARLEAYRELGARFSKWRAVLRIGAGRPSDLALDVNAHALARYAALSQEAGLVPIVEPEVLMDGAHDVDACYDASERALRTVFAELARQRVELEGVVLKPSMVLSGKDAPDRAPPEVVAERTLSCLLRCVPAAVPGIAFLSGGQGDEEAAVNLDAINRLAARRGAPWQLTFSYGRGLQAAPLQAWAGRPERVAAAQRAFLERARDVAAARMGRYEPVGAD